MTRIISTNKLLCACFFRLALKFTKLHRKHNLQLTDVSNNPDSNR